MEEVESIVVMASTGSGLRNYLIQGWWINRNQSQARNAPQDCDDYRIVMFYILVFTYLFSGDQF